MKKLIITTAVLACAAIVTAQTVTSQNIVGYTKLTATAGELDLFAINFDTGGATVQDLIGAQLPNNSQIFLWDKDAVPTPKYVTITKNFLGNWLPNEVLDNGDAFWVKAVGSGDYEVVLAGEVLTVETNSVPMPALVATGYFFPVETLWTATDLAAQLPNGSKVYVWNKDAVPPKYETHTKNFLGNWPTAGAVVISPTTGVWVDPIGAWSGVWNEERPFTP